MRRLEAASSRPALPDAEARSLMVRVAAAAAQLLRVEQQLESSLIGHATEIAQHSRIQDVRASLASLRARLGRLGALSKQRQAHALYLSCSRDRRDLRRRTGARAADRRLIRPRPYPLMAGGGLFIIAAVFGAIIVSSWRLKKFCASLLNRLFALPKSFLAGCQGPRCPRGDAFGRAPRTHVALRRMWL